MQRPSGDPSGPVLGQTATHQLAFEDPQAAVVADEPRIPRLTGGSGYRVAYQAVDQVRRIAGWGHTLTLQHRPQRPVRVTKAQSEGLGCRES
jgi:hypothetical protein